MNRVLIVELPQSYMGDKVAEMRDYIIDSIEKGVLVLKHGTTTHIEELPELGAVEVVPRCTKPAEPPKLTVPEAHVVLNTAKSASAETGREAHTTEAALSPAPVPLDSTEPSSEDNAVDIMPPRGKLASMSAYEVVESFKHAAHPKNQIKILAELNSCSEAYIRYILTSEGIELPKRGGRPRKEHAE